MLVISTALTDTRPQISTSPSVRKQISRRQSSVGEEIEQLLSFSGRDKHGTTRPNPTILIKNLTNRRLKLADITTFWQKPPLPLGLRSLSDSSINYSTIPNNTCLIVKEFRQATCSEERRAIVKNMSGETAHMLMTQLNEEEQDEVANILDDEYKQQTETKKLADETLGNHINEIFMSYNDSLLFSPETFKKDARTLIKKIMQDTKIKEKINKSDSIIISCVISNIEKFDITDEQKTIIKNEFMNAYQWVTILKDANLSASEIDRLSLSF